MSLLKKPQIVEAVMLFNDEGQICQEMLYPEFESLLDGVVNLETFAGRQARGAFVLINPRLQIMAVVLFHLDFAADGRADPSWNIPLRHLAEYASHGPDLGGGPIQLACRSQCPVDLHQGSLWDPSLAPTQNDLLQIRDAVRRNNLGVIFDDDRPLSLHTGKLNMAPEHHWYIHPADMALIEQAAPRRDSRRMEEEERHKAAQLIKQQRLRISMLTKQNEEALAKERLQASRREQSLQMRMETLERALKLQMERNQGLRQQLSDQAEGFEQVRSEMGRQLEALTHDGMCEINALRTQFEHEMQLRLESAAVDFQEQLLRQSDQLASQHALLEQQQARIQTLESECERLAREGGDQILQRLTEQGVMFIAYHPGAGHLTIPLHEIPEYQRSPLAYAARHCLVTEEQYSQWLEHYQNPGCSATRLGGERCGIPLDRVDSPTRFVAGESDCCSRHRKQAGPRLAPDVVS